MDLPLVDVVSVLVWCVLIRSWYRSMWRFVALCWPGSELVYWPSGNRSV